MHRFVTPYYCLVLLAGALFRPALADIIHLKNGEAIYADQTKQTASGIEYQKGDDSYTIPNSVVQSVEKRRRYRRPALRSPSKRFRFIRLSRRRAAKNSFSIRYCTAAK